MANHRHIFLGHASEDKLRVRELYYQLKAEGFAPWLDKEDLHPGQNWEVEIPKAIKSAAVFLACLSRNSVSKRSYVQKEFRHALSVLAEVPQDSIYLIPVRLDDCEVPELSLQELNIRLSSLHWVDLFEEDGFDRLAKAIEYALGSEPKGQHEKVPSNFTKSTSSESKVADEKRNPTIVAAWIGAGALIVSGAMSSPLLIDLYRLPSEPEPIEQAAPTPEKVAQATSQTNIQDGSERNGLVLPPSNQRVESEQVEDNNEVRHSSKEYTDTQDSSERTETHLSSTTNKTISAPMQAGEAFYDCKHCPEMVVIPAGSFLMGSSENEIWGHENERPQRLARLPQSIAVGKYEVTQGEWGYCVKAGVCPSLENNSSSGDERYPVFGINWDEAKVYVSWLSRITGENYRLLSEAEWEYAARSSSKTNFSWGETIRPEQANYDWARLISGQQSYNPTNRSPPYAPLPVGSFQANVWNLHDFHGNVNEWVEDCWNSDYKSISQMSSVVPQTDGFCFRKVVRGGGWASPPIELRAAFRGNANPVDRAPDLGFRVARSYLQR